MFMLFQNLMIFSILWDKKIYILRIVSLFFLVYTIEIIGLQYISLG